MPPLFKKPIPDQAPVVNLNNSVRHPVPYQGSTNLDDLMDLYVGNTHYRKINRYMRSPNHQTGVNEILDEIAVRDGRKPLSQADALVKITGEREAANFYLNDVLPAQEQFLANPDPDFNQFSDSPLGQFYNHSPEAKHLTHLVGNIADVGDYTKAAQTVLSKPIDYRVNELSSWKPLRQEAEQVVASIPLINNILVAKPLSTEGMNHQQMAQDWVQEISQAGLQNTSPKFAEFEKFIADDLVLGNLWKEHEALGSYVVEHAKKIGSGKIKIPVDKEIPTSLSRGLHFKNQADYDDFVKTHQPGQIVEYPAFTSTTSDPNIQDSFSGKRSGQHPVLMEIQPTNGQFAGRWADNPAESEYLYPPNSRFEVISSEPIEGKMPGTKLIARETTAQTPVEARTSGIMGRLKSKAFVPEPQPVAAEALLNEHLKRQSRLGQTRSAYRDRMSTTSQSVPMSMGYDSSDRILMA
jgi:hypothetical protein